MSEKKLEQHETFEEFYSWYTDRTQHDCETLTDTDVIKFATHCIRKAGEEEAEDFLLRLIHLVRRTERFSIKP